MSLEPDAVVVRILTTLRREVPGVWSNKSSSSSSSLEFIEMVTDCVLTGRVLSGFNFRGDCLNPLEPKSSRCLPAPGAIPVLGGRACMRRDGSESMVRPVRENWRSTCSILRPLSLRRRAGCGIRSPHYFTHVMVATRVAFLPAARPSTFNRTATPDQANCRTVIV